MSQGGGGQRSDVRIPMEDGIELAATLYVPDASHGPQPCLLEAQHVLRFGLIVLGIHVRRDEAYRRNPLATYGLGQAAQIGRGRHHLDAILRNSRRCQDKKRDCESQTCALAVAIYFCPHGRFSRVHHRP